MTESNTATEALLVAARDHGNKLAFSANGDPITYAALWDDVQRLAGHLIANRLSAGDRCALLLPTGIDFIRLLYAVQLAGGVPVAISPDLPPEAVWRRLQLVRAELTICEAAASSRLRREQAGAPVCRFLTVKELSVEGRGSAAWTLPDPAGAAFLQLTSGTTGEPRAAVISHRSLLASLAAAAMRLNLSSNDVLATWVPLHHDLGLVRYVFGAVLARCPSHLIRPSIVQLQPWLELLTRVRATITGGPDSAYRLAARTVDPDGIDLRSLRFAGNGGEPVRLTTIEQFERRFGLSAVVRPAYGLAEATLTVTSAAPGEPLRVDAWGTVSCGRAVDGFELRIADADGRHVTDGAVGEVLLRGAAVFDGYFNDEESTRSVLRNGWLHTGDHGSLDTEGHLFLKGRSRALIKRGGVAIAPREIEDAVNRVADVEGSAALGVPGRSGSGTEDIVVVAEIRASQASARLADVIQAAIDVEVKQSLGWSPARIVLVASGAIPRTTAGKVRYDQLREMVTEETLPRLVTRAGPRESS